MNNIDVMNIIVDLADHLLISTDCVLEKDRVQNNHASLRDGVLAMKFKVHIQMENYGYEKDGHTHHPEWEKCFLRDVHIIVTARHNVFAAVMSGHRYNLVSSDYQNTSNHDSCWRTDGLRIIQDTLFKGYEECFDSMPEEHRPAPIMTSPYLQLGEGFMGSPFELVRAWGEYNKADDFRWRLTKIMPVKWNINVTDHSCADEI